MTQEVRLIISVKKEEEEEDIERACCLIESALNSSLFGDQMLRKVLATVAVYCFTDF